MLYRAVTFAFSLLQGPSHPLKQQFQTYLKTSTSEDNNLKPRQIKVKIAGLDEWHVFKRRRKNK